MSNPVVKRALVSVTDKSGIVEFCRALRDEFNVELVSTGGTYKVLSEAGLAVTPIDELTGFPEMMDGRVKTLHPRVHGGLLAVRSNDEHMKQAADNDISMIDMVVVNLYEFKKAIDAGVVEAEAIEHIDIGGPSMLRSAAKNFASVAVVSNPLRYEEVLAALRSGKGALSLEFRRELATEVFKTTSEYDRAIWGYLSGEGELQEFGDYGDLHLTKAMGLRYGENPHQHAAFYKNHTPLQNSLAEAKQIQGKELSYNNLLDTDAAWAAVREFETFACVIVKHTNPCGVSWCNDSILRAYQKAHEADPISAYGGIMAFNSTVTAELIEGVYANKQFVEVIIAPDYEEQALELLQKRPNLRVLATGGVNPLGADLSIRSVEGGFLVQEEDFVGEDPADFTVVTERVPSEEEMEQLLFAWKVAKSVKSNAIILVDDYATVGVGAGQMNRVKSAQIAVEQAGEKAHGAVCASDAFLPFSDTLEVVSAAGVKALIQPGGSVRDAETIARANELGVAMVFTANRHFRH